MNVKPLIAGAGVAAAALVAAFLLGAQSERHKINLKLNEAVSKAVSRRAEINEKLGDMGAVDLCLELGGVPADCQQLRRLGQDRP